MVDDGGLSNSLIAPGKMKIKDVLVNEYTGLYMNLKYKTAIRLINDDVEEFIVTLAYAIIMPNFAQGKYHDGSFKELMITGPEKTIDSESMWTPIPMKAVGVDNAIITPQLTISGEYHIKKATSKSFVTGIDKKIRENYTELDIEKYEVDVEERNEKIKFERTQNLKSQIENEYKELVENQSKLKSKKSDLEQELKKVKNLINLGK